MVDLSSQLSTREEVNSTAPERRRKAVALRYQSGEDAAPVVIAKGAGTVAERIMELARKHDIPLYRDPDLVSILSTIDLGNAIPPELYQAVAEILAFVYRINQKFAKNMKIDS